MMNRFLIGLPFFILALSSHAQKSLMPDSPGLVAYVGKDLRRLEATELKKFREQTEKLTGDKPEKKEWGAYEPWWVKPFIQNDKAWLWLEAYPGYAVPDVSSLQVHIFDTSWKRVVKQSFPTGYRQFLKEVTLNVDTPLKQPLLVATLISSGPFVVQEGTHKPAFEQGDFQRQYYALLNDRFVLIRLEDNTGKIIPNHYLWRTPLKGPPVPQRMVQEWIRTLRSTNATEQLATLVWLSGAHRSSSEVRKEDINQESVADSEIFEAVRRAPETRQIVRELAEKATGWVQEYARFTQLSLGK